MSEDDRPTSEPPEPAPEPLRKGKRAINLSDVNKAVEVLKAAEIPKFEDKYAGTFAEMPRRRVGWMRDAFDARDRSTKALFGARRGVPAEASLEHLMLGIRDQGSTNACVGMAIGTAVDVRLRRTGITTAPMASALAVYTLARSVTDAPLLDLGCHPRLAFRAMREHGIPSEGVWPFSEGEVATKLPWDVLQQASAFRVAAWWRIDSEGDERIEDVCQAIAAGYPVVFGLDVDRAFLEYSRGGAPLGALGEDRIGGHMTCLLGYRTENNRRILRGANSWGIGWGDAGMYDAYPEFLLDASAGDFYVIQVG